MKKLLFLIVFLIFFVFLSKGINNQMNKNIDLSVPYYSELRYEDVKIVK